MLKVGQYVTLKWSRGQPKMRIVGKGSLDGMVSCNAVNNKGQTERFEILASSLIPWEERRKAKQ